MKIYSVTVEHGARFWLVRVSELGYSTQARHLREVDTMARDLIAVMMEIDPDSFDLDVHIKVPQEIQAHLDLARQLREQAAEANSGAAAESRAAAKALHDDGLSVRDIGEVLGVSYQRAHQLVSAKAA